MYKSTDKVVLRGDVIIEPLVAGWHAWPHLISPATAALNFKHRLILQMESFLSAPELHEMACKSPELRGGPFLNISRDDLALVRQLLDKTRNEQHLLVEFAEAIVSGFKMIIQDADGSSIETFYEKLPEPLKGFVELTYTLGGNPDLRVIEPMLYMSPYYNPNNQHAQLFIQKSDERSFAFSTPRLERPDSIELGLPFADEIYDYLSALRNASKPWADVKARLNLSNVDSDKFAPFFTKDVPTNSKPPARQITGALSWRYFGHACILIETSRNRSVLIDPVIAYPLEGGEERFTFKDLPDQIDYIVLTHNHSDHVSIETLLALRSKTSTVVVPRSGNSLADPSLKLMLEAIGFKNVLELDALGSCTLDDLKITAIPFLGEHGDLNIQAKAAWLIEASHKKMLFAADSNNLEPRLYKKVREIYGKIDVLFIGMECLGAPVSWVYGPLLPIPLDRRNDQSRRLNGSDCSRGLALVETLGCGEVHVYAMGLEPWMQYITSIDPSEETIPMKNATEFIESCLSKGIQCDRLYGKFESTL